jgi:hypothetical protein
MLDHFVLDDAKKPEKIGVETGAQKVELTAE